MCSEKSETSIPSRRVYFLSASTSWLYWVENKLVEQQQIYQGATKAITPLFNGFVRMYDERNLVI